MTHRRHGVLTLVAALALHASVAGAQYTGGRIGGSNWGAAQPPPPPPAPVIAPPPPPPVIAPPPPPPVIAPPPPPPAQVVPPPPAQVVPPPPAQVVPPPPAQVVPPPPAERIPVHRWQRGTGSPGEQVVDARERSADEGERRAASPSWSGGTESGPAKVGAGLLAGAVTFGVLLALVMLLTRRRRGPAAYAQPIAGHGPVPHRPASVRPAAHPGVELRQVSVAFDWTVRAQLQKQLAALAARVDPSTPPGLHAVAVAAQDLLSSAHRAARYATFQSFAVDPASAQGAFARLADRARSRYTVETVDNARRALGPELRARAEEGAGLVVVTLLVASNGPLPNLPTTVDVPSVMNTLQEAVPPRAERLLALEVVWSPAAESDRMSSAELVALYPELLPLDPRAALGRRVCAHCHAVFALELGRCPACGAG